MNKENSTIRLIAAIARRDNAAREGTVFSRPMRDSYRAASRFLRIRRSGYAAKVWNPGRGENTAAIAHVAGGYWV